MCVCPLPVVVWFERSGFVEAEVLGLVVAQLGEVRVEALQVQRRHVLICGSERQRAWSGGVGGARQVALHRVLDSTLGASNLMVFEATQPVGNSIIH